jgi:hypothetical protein
VVVWRANGAVELYTYDQSRNKRCGMSHRAADFRFQSGKWHDVAVYVRVNDAFFDDFRVVEGRQSSTGGGTPPAPTPTTRPPAPTPTTQPPVAVPTRCRIGTLDEWKRTFVANDISVRTPAAGRSTGGGRRSRCNTTSRSSTCGARR